MCFSSFTVDLFQEMGYNDGYGSYGPYGLAYQAQAQPPPPPPPPHPSQMNGAGNSDPAAIYNRGLNVVDPRFAAKYGNPYLRTSPTAGTNPGGSPMLQGRMKQQQQQQPQQRGYATMYGRSNAAANVNGNGSYSPVHHGTNGAGSYATMSGAKGSNPAGNKAKLPHNYVGTMVGNGSSSGNGLSRSGGTSQYILSPDTGDAKANAMATHV